MGILEELRDEVRTLNESIGKQAAEIAALREKIQPGREVYRLKDLVELPEAPALKTLRNNPARQPRGGVPDGYAGREKAWRRDTVLEWRRQLAENPYEDRKPPRRKQEPAA